MPADVNVTTDPLLVFGMIGLLMGALVLALIFAWPRRGYGAATKSDAAGTPADEAWMPGGDIFGREPAPPEPAEQLPTYPTYPDPALGAIPSAPPAAPDPWSSSPSEQVSQQPRWDRG